MTTEENKEIMDYAVVKFAQEFKKLCAQYVATASVFKINFKDGSLVGMKTLLLYGLGHISLEDCIDNK